MTNRRLPPPFPGPDAGRVFRPSELDDIDHDNETTETLDDQQLRDLHDRHILALVDAIPDAPQVRWDDAGRCWRPIGRTVRCAVEAGAALDEPLVVIDQLELNLAELGRMLAGHGAQICLVFLDE